MAARQASDQAASQATMDELFEGDMHATMSLRVYNSVITNEAVDDSIDLTPGQGPSRR